MVNKQHDEKVSKLTLRAPVPFPPVLKQAAVERREEQGGRPGGKEQTHTTARCRPFTLLSRPPPGHNDVP